MWTLQSVGQQLKGMLLQRHTSQKSLQNIFAYHIVREVRLIKICHPCITSDALYLCHMHTSHIPKSARDFGILLVCIWHRYKASLVMQGWHTLMRRSSRTTVTGKSLAHFFLGQKSCTFFLEFFRGPHGE